MIEVISLLKERRTTRAFSKKKVSKEDIDIILEAGRFAPSSLNMQPWIFIVIKNKKTIDSILKLCYYGSSDKNPPILVALILDKNENVKAELLNKYENRFMPYLNYMNIAMPALNMCYQATSMGIGSGIKTPGAKALSKILKLPEGYECPILVALGHKEAELHEPQIRKPMKELIFYEKFGGKRFWIF